MTGLGQIAGDDVPSWFLDLRSGLLFPLTRNRVRSGCGVPVPAQSDSWIGEIPGRKKLKVRGTVNSLKENKWFVSLREPNVSTLSLQERKNTRFNSCELWTFYSDVKLEKNEVNKCVLIACIDRILAGHFLPASFTVRFWLCCWLIIRFHGKMPRSCFS